MQTSQIVFNGYYMVISVNQIYSYKFEVLILYEVFSKALRKTKQATG